MPAGFWGPFHQVRSGSPHAAGQGLQQNGPLGREGPGRVLKLPVVDEEGDPLLRDSVLAGTPIEPQKAASLEQLRVLVELLEAQVGAIEDLGPPGTLSAQGQNLSRNLDKVPSTRRIAHGLILTKRFRFPCLLFNLSS